MVRMMAMQKTLKINIEVMVIESGIRKGKRFWSY